MRGLLLIIGAIFGLMGKVASVNWVIWNYWQRCVKSAICSNWTLRNVNNIVCNC